MTAPRVPPAPARPDSFAPADALRTASSPTTISAVPSVGAISPQVAELEDQQARAEEEQQRQQAGLTAALTPAVGTAAEPAARFLLTTKRDFMRGFHTGRAVGNELTSDVVGGVATGAMNLDNAIAKNTVNVGVLATKQIIRGANLIRAHFGLGPSQRGQEFLDFWNDPANDPRGMQPIPQSTVDAADPHTFLGGIVSGLTQWGPGFAIASEALPFSAGAGALSKVVTLAGRQAVTDAVFFDAYQPRLSNFLQTTGLAGPLTELAQADPNDSFAKAKFKQVAEGVLLSSGMELMAAGYAHLASQAASRGEQAAARTFAEQAAQTAREAAAQPKPATVVMDASGPAVEVHFPSDQPIPARGTPEYTLYLEAELRGAQRAAETDQLTQLGNQRAWERARATAEADPNTSIITFDLNNFKALNDAKGHSAGNDLIERMGQAIKSVTDRGFRTGGDEFTVIAPKEQADHLRQTIEDLFGEHPFTNSQGQSFRASTSGSVGDTFDQADQALQAVKAARKAATGGVAPRQSGTSPALSLQRDASHTGLDSDGSETYNILENGQDVGLVSVKYNPQTKNIHVGWLRAGPAPTTAAETLHGTGKFGVGTLVSLKEELQKVYPDAVSISGERATGLGSISGNPTHVKPLRPAGSLQIPAASVEDAQTTASVLNHEAQVAARPRGPAALTPETVDAIRRAVREANGMSEGVVSQATGSANVDGVDKVFSKYIGNLNLSYFQTPEETNALFEGIYKVFREEMQAARGTRSLAESNARAVQLMDGVSQGDATSLVQRWAAESGDAEAKALASRFFLGAQAQQVSTLSAFADAHPENAAAYEALARGMDYLFRTQEALTSISASAGRTLRIHQVPVTGAELAIRDGVVQAGDQAAVDAAQAAGAAARTSSEATATRIYAGMSKDQIQGLARYIRFSNGSPDAIRQILKVTQEIAHNAGNPTAMQQLVRWRMNFLLSGLKTSAGNMFSNVVTAFHLPLEYAWAGVRYNDPAALSRGAQTMIGLFTEAAESWKVAKQAFMEGRNVLDASSAMIDPQFANAAPEPSLLMMLDTPSKFLMAQDEFFKVLNYRSAIRARSIAQSAADGVTDLAIIGQRLSQDLSAAFTRGGQAIDPAALEYAKEATHTRRLVSDLGQLVEQAGNNPGVRLIAPFIRTPTNLLKYAWERFPGLNMLSSEVRADLAAGGIRADRRLAQINMSNALLKFTTMAAIGGQITGGGPKDPKLRKQLMDGGWKPWSVKTVDGDYVSYRRGDPLTTNLGLVAMYVELSGGAPEFDSDQGAGALALATIGAASSKTWMQGVSQFADLMGSGATKQEWERFLGGLVTSTLVPAAVSQLNGDDTMRQARSYFDELRARIPGQSENLEPRRNVFGEPVLQPPGFYNKTLNPFTVSPGSRVDPIQEQLVALGAPLATPSQYLGPGRTIDMGDRTAWNTGWQKLPGRTKAAREASGELPQSPYDRLMELMGTTKLEGRTLRETVTQLVQSPEWAAVEDAPADFPGGVRLAKVQQILQTYKTAAMAQVLHEYPLLRSAYARERTNAYLAKNSLTPQTDIAQNRGLFAQVDSALSGTGPAQPSQQVSDIVRSIFTSGN